MLFQATKLEYYVMATKGTDGRQGAIGICYIDPICTNHLTVPEAGSLLLPVSTSHL